MYPFAEARGPIFIQWQREEQMGRILAVMHCCQRWHSAQAGGSPILKRKLRLCCLLLLCFVRLFLWLWLMHGTPINRSVTALPAHCVLFVLLLHRRCIAVAWGLCWPDCGAH